MWLWCTALAEWTLAKDLMAGGLTGTRYAMADECSEAMMDPGVASVVMVVVSDGGCENENLCVCVFLGKEGGRMSGKEQRTREA
jgi:hypothetical protein